MQILSIIGSLSIASALAFDIFLTIPGRIELGIWGAFITYFLAFAGLVFIHLERRELTEVINVCSAACLHSSDELVTQLSHDFRRWYEFTRKNGLVAIEAKEIEKCRDSFLRKGLKHAAEGKDFENLNRELETQEKCDRAESESGLRSLAVIQRNSMTAGMITSSVPLIGLAWVIGNSGKMGPLIGHALLASLLGTFMSQAVLSVLIERTSRDYQRVLKYYQVLRVGFSAIFHAEDEISFLSKLSQAEKGELK